MTLYLLHYKRVAFPVLDFGLLRLRTMRAAIVGGFLFRLGIGALPFLLPLLLQVGFGLTPFQSGLITFGSAVGALFMKTLAARMINTFGFRNIMTVDAIVSAVFLAVCALFTPTTPLSLILVLLIVGGFFRSLQFTAINTIGYAEVDMARMSRATTLVSVTQQLAISAGVAVGAFSVELTLLMRKGTDLVASDFGPAFIVVALISASSAIVFALMPSDAGHQVPAAEQRRSPARRKSTRPRRKRRSRRPRTFATSGWGERPARCGSVFSVDFDDVVLGVAKEQRAVAPVRQIRWPPQNWHTIGDQFRVTGIDRRRRYTKGELDCCRSRYRFPIVEGAPPARPQRKQRGADAKTDPVLAISLNRKLHDVAVKRARFLHLAAQQDCVIEVRNSTQAHNDTPRSVLLSPICLEGRACC